MRGGTAGGEAYLNKVIRGGGEGETELGCWVGRQSGLDGDVR